MRPIDADELKNTLDKIKIVIDEGILDCNTIHETLVYLLGKVEAAVNEAIDEQPTIEPETEALERIVERLEIVGDLGKVVKGGRGSRGATFASGIKHGIEKAIEIVKEEMGKEA